jgi:hypothetical protein
MFWIASKPILTVSANSRWVVGIDFKGQATAVVFVSDLLNCLEKHGGNTLPTVGLRDNDIMDINEPTAFKRREAEKTIDQPDCLCRPSS